MMFRGLSFEHHPTGVQDEDEAEEAEGATPHVSPTSLSTESGAKEPSPSPSVDKLANMLDCHSLRVEVDPAYEFSTEKDPATSLQHRQPPSYSHGSTAVHSRHRHVNARKQLRSSHLKEASELIERMVDEEDQCQVVEQPKSPQLLPASPGADGGDGTDMDCDPDELLFTLPFRRSGDRPKRCAAVTKHVRIRRTAKIMKKGSSR